MNYSLARELYGEQVWAIEASFIPSLLESLHKTDFNPADRKNTFSFFEALSGESNGASKTEVKNLISVTNINGPIMKSGGASSTGMKELSGDLLSADSNKDFIGHLFIFDTPGGSITGMKYMQGTVKSLSKPKVGLVERDSISASAGYGILSEMDFTFAESDSSEVGSIGVVSGVLGRKNGMPDANNELQYIVYASKSTRKNEASRAAIEHNDTSLLLAEADKINDEFHAGIKAKMPNIQDDQMTGAMYPASEVVGTMIHAIGSKTEAVNKILELSKIKNTFNENLNKNSKKAMTAAEILAQHAEAHAEILAAGLSAERERVKTWMVFHDIDPAAVKVGIASGKDVSPSEQAAFLLKATTQNALTNLKKDSAGNIVTPEANEIGVELTAKQKADQAEYEALFPKQKGKVDINKVKFN